MSSAPWFRARRTNLLCLVLCLTVILLLGSDSVAAEQPEVRPARPALQDVYPGVLMPGLSALIKARQDEQVASLSVRVGSRLKKGQRMLQFVDAEERLLVKRAEVVLRQARLEFERTQQLHAQQQISEEVMERAQTNLSLAEADLGLARIRLDEMSVRAPFDGIVAQRYVDPGASVEIGDSLLRVSALTPLRLEALLPQEALPRLRAASAIEVTLAATEEVLRLPVSLGPVVVDPASGSFLLQVEVDNRQERLVPGVSCRIAIVHTPPEVP